MNVDQWRRSEAEARQEMQTRTCTNCGDTMDDCDAWECPECHEYYCKECLPKPGQVCPVCQEKDDTFNEVAEIDIGHPLYVDDPYGVMDRFRRMAKRDAIKAELAERKRDEERGK